jgi:hypothetical protein
VEITTYWTDYPVVALGDTPSELAPIRECEPLSYDGDKYVTVRVQGIVTDFKSGYLYPRHQRAGVGPAVSRAFLESLPVTP